MVHPLPRGYRLAEENFDSLSRRRGSEERYRQHAVPGGKHAGADILSAGRCGGDAEHRIRGEIPQRVRGTFRWEAVPLRKSGRGGTGLRALGKLGDWGWCDGALEKSYA